MDNSHDDLLRDKCSDDDVMERLFGSYSGCGDGYVCEYKKNEELELAFSVCIEKEIAFMPQPHFVTYLSSHNLCPFRLRMIQWFLKVCFFFQGFHMLCVY